MERQLGILHQNRINKKGIIYDILYLPIVLFMLAVISFIMIQVVKDYRSQAEEGGVITGQNLEVLDNYVDKNPAATDTLFIITMVGLTLIAVVSAFFVASHPVFYIFIAVLLAIFTWFNAFYANIYQEIATTDMLIDSANDFVVIPFVMRWFPMIMLVISIIIAIVFTAKGTE